MYFVRLSLRIYLHLSIGHRHVQEYGPEADQGLAWYRGTAKEPGVANPASGPSGRAYKSRRVLCHEEQCLG